MNDIDHDILRREFLKKWHVVDDNFDLDGPSFHETSVILFDCLSYFFDNCILKRNKYVDKYMPYFEKNIKLTISSKDLLAARVSAMTDADALRGTNDELLLQIIIMGLFDGDWDPSPIL